MFYRFGSSELPVLNQGHDHPFQVLPLTVLLFWDYWSWICFVYSAISVPHLNVAGHHLLAPRVLLAVLPPAHLLPSEDWGTLGWSFLRWGGHKASDGTSDCLSLVCIFVWKLNQVVDFKETTKGRYRSKVVELLGKFCQAQFQLQCLHLGTDFQTWSGIWTVVWKLSGFGMFL